jgi:2-haloalkanoic acid dehalogenase type II
LLVRYHVLERELEGDGTRTYREVLTEAMRGLAVPPDEEDALARSLPGWKPFSEVPQALEAARERGWKLAILSNTDRDYIEASLGQLGVPFELAIVASEVGSYKPALGHWRAFEERVGRLPDVHVAASLFHDIGPANELGLRSIWINRLGETPGPQPTRELPDLARLPETLDGLA